MKKKYRLLKNEEFESIIKGKKFRSSKTLTIYFQPKVETNSRIGISVGKKIGNAVVRNKIKRQMKTIVVAHIDFDKYENDLVILVRKDYLVNNYKVNEELFLQLMKKV